MTGAARQARRPPPARPTSSSAPTATAWPTSTSPLCSTSTARTASSRRSPACTRRRASASSSRRATQVHRFAEKPAGGGPSPAASSSSTAACSTAVDRPVVRPRARAARGPGRRRRAGRLPARRLLAVRRHGARRRVPALTVGRRQGALARLGRPPDRRRPCRATAGRSRRRHDAAAAARRRRPAAGAGGRAGGRHLPHRQLALARRHRHGALLGHARPRAPTAPGDRFLLSKGHAASGSTACSPGPACSREQVLDGYCRDGGTLAGHPERGLPGVEITGGSLGHGLPIAVGMRSPTARTAATGAPSA